MLKHYQNRTANESKAKNSFKRSKHGSQECGASTDSDESFNNYHRIASLSQGEHTSSMASTMNVENNNANVSSINSSPHSNFEWDEGLLIKLPIKELNLELKKRNFNKRDVNTLKGKRRTLKSRGYAAKDRKNKVYEMQQLGDEVSNLRKLELKLFQDLNLKSFDEVVVNLKVVNELLLEIDDYEKSNSPNLSDSEDE